MISNEKKGQITIQFHWVFALIGGILFLLFFFILIRSVTDTEEQKQTLQQGFAIDSILKTAPTNPDTFSVIDVPNANYRFYCDDTDPRNIESYVRINGGDYTPETLRHVPLFSPREINGDQIFTATKTWTAPFPIGSLVVASNNRTRYVIVASATGATRAGDFLEAQDLGSFGFDIITTGNLNSYEETGFDQYRFIFFETQFTYTTLPAAFKEATNTALLLDFDGSVERGELTFIDNLASPSNSESDSVTFYGEAMAVAAIFSHDAAIFECNMKKAEEKMAIVAEILEKRLVALKAVSGEEFSDNERCQEAYDWAMTNGFTNPNTVENLIAQNRRLLMEGCPRLY